jgi:hypothetical protein
MRLSISYELSNKEMKRHGVPPGDLKRDPVVICKGISSLKIEMQIELRSELRRVSPGHRGIKRRDKTGQVEICKVTL